MSTIGGVGGFGGLPPTDFRGARRTEDQRQELFLPQSPAAPQRTADAASEREYQAHQATEEGFARLRVGLQSSSVPDLENNAGKGGIGSSKKDEETNTALEEFKAYMAMTPGEKIRDSILKEMGLTEDDIKDMPPEQQETVEKEIAERMKERSEIQAEAERTPEGQLYGIV